MLGTATTTRKVFNLLCSAIVIVFSVSFEVWAHFFSPQSMLHDKVVNLTPFVQWGTILFPTAFYRTSLSYAIVNIKPIIPGHVLVIPTRSAIRLTDLTEDEVSSLFLTVQKVGKVVEKAFKADALTIACQDGKAAGQSIPHVHVHILPRRLRGDRFEDANDNIYPEIEKSEKNLPRHLRAHAARAEEVETFRVDADEDRQPRTVEEMEKEATWLHGFFKSS